jgi:hypothetical protein
VYFLGNALSAALALVSTFMGAQCFAEDNFHSLGLPAINQDTGINPEYLRPEFQQEQKNLEIMHPTTFNGKVEVMSKRMSEIRSRMAQKSPVTWARIQKACSSGGSIGSQDLNWFKGVIQLPEVTSTESDPDLMGWSERQLFALSSTAFGEARGEGRVGMLAVMRVIRDRSRKNGTSLLQEALAPYQFSVWLSSDRGNLPCMIAGPEGTKPRSQNDAHLESVRSAADLADEKARWDFGGNLEFGGVNTTPAQSITHYVTASLYRQSGRGAWWQKMKRIAPPPLFTLT